MRCPLGLALGLLSPLAIWGAPAQVQEVEMAGYLLVPNEKVPTNYNAGFSLYVAAWPLLQQYPGHEFQSGLPGTWMFAQYDGQAPTNLYSDIEGGLGWWRDTRFGPADRETSRSWCIASLPTTKARSGMP